MKKSEFNIKEYVRQMAAMNDLPVADEYADEVAANLARVAEVYQLVSDFTLPDNIEPAPTFEP